jgi:hypothetical protein
MPKLAAGQVWRRRDSKLVTLKQGRGSAEWFLDDTSNWIYCDDERWPDRVPKFVFNERHITPYDLMELVEGGKP